MPCLKTDIHLTSIVLCPADSKKKEQKKESMGKWACQLAGALNVS